MRKEVLYMSVAFFGLLRLGREDTTEVNPDFPEKEVPPITRRILDGMPQELTEESCAQRLRQVAAEYGYGIKIFSVIDSPWWREVTDLLLAERPLPGVNKKLMTQVVLPFGIYHPGSPEGGSHLILHREFGGDSGWKHILLPRFMIDVFFEEWVCESVFVFRFYGGVLMPEPKDVLAKPVSIFQAAADITAALFMSVDDSIGPVASYTNKSGYHPRVDRILSSFGTYMPAIQDVRIRAAEGLTNHLMKLLGEIDDNHLKRELIEKLRLKLENR